MITRPPELAKRPRWKVIDGDTFAGRCVEGRGIVRKSGKQGFGIALRLRSRGDCRFEIRSAALVFPHHTLAIAPPAAVELAGRSQHTMWLPVPFDNNRVWNDRDNDATLELSTPDGTWRIAMHQGAP